MITQEQIITFLCILIFFLSFGLYILKKSLYNHNLKLQEELRNYKIETKKEFERIRFTEKPICKVADSYNGNFLVTRVKYKEEEKYQYIGLLHQQQYGTLLNIGYEYEIFNIKTSEFTHFNWFIDFKKFLEVNNLTLDERKD